MDEARDRKIRLVMDVARRTGLARLLSPLLSGIGCILMLHRVADRAPGTLGINDGLTVSPAFLDAMLTEVKRLGYALVSMDEAVAALQKGAHGKFAAITLDDGYLDNLVNALPVFEAHGAPFTIYAAPALVDGRIALWWEEVDRIVCSQTMLGYATPAGPVELAAATHEEKKQAAGTLFAYVSRDLAEADQQAFLKGLDPAAAPPAGSERLMRWDELKTISDHPLGTIGAHTLHHYSLGRLPEEEARREIVESGRVLRERLGAEVRHFAYPYGHAEAAGEREVRLAAEAGYISAVTTRHGVLQAGHHDHLHALPRISVNGRFQDVAYIRTMLSGFTTVANSRRRLVTV